MKTSGVFRISQIALVRIHIKRISLEKTVTKKIHF